MKKKLFTLGLCVCFLSATSFIVSTLAWIKNIGDIEIVDGKGYSESQYFESGNGSESNPYIISNSNHLYNFAWLQYLGNFNNSSNTIYHFKLKNSIDMSNYVLPPIGTTVNPFIGVFDGQDFTISNLTVSNSINDIPTRPQVVNNIFDVSIVGFFGVIGDPDITGLVAENAFDFSSLSSGKTVSNFYLENIKIKSTTSRTLIGVVAGYADGSIHDIGVKNASLEVIDNATGLSLYDTVLSKYSLIGDTTDVEWKKAYSNKFNGGEGSGGDDTGFGGSINMWDINRRVTYILKKDAESTTAGSQIKTYNNSSSNTYKAYLYMTNSNRMCVTSTGPIGDGSNGLSQKSGIIQLRSGVLPINTDTTTMFEGTETITSYKPSGYSHTWYFACNNYYLNNTSEIIADNNTGYFVGDKPYGTSSTSGAVVFGTKAKVMMQNSYSSVGGDLKLYSIKPTDSSFSYIKDVNNQSSSTQTNGKDTTYYGYSNYEKVVNSVKSSLDNAITTGYLNGFRLTSYNPAISSAFNVSNVKICGQSYSTYQFINRSVNFTVEKKGKITLVLTGYGDSVSGAKSSFRLFSVGRNDSHNITNLTEISKVYTSTTDNSISYNSPSNSNDVLVYDYSKWNNCLAESTLYYCEIPVNPGDYCITGPNTSSSQYTGYLVYLDIGANGSESSGGSGGSTSGYDLKNIRYVHIIPQVTADGDTYMDILFRISTAAAAGDSKMYFKRMTSDLLYYYQQNTSSDIELEITVFITEDDTVVQENSNAIWN